jgi:CheY-like chemotaxis protein
VSCDHLLTNPTIRNAKAIVRSTQEMKRLTLNTAHSNSRRSKKWKTDRQNVALVVVSLVCSQHDSMHRVLIIDDSNIFRRSLRAILSTRTGWKICAEAGNADDGVLLAERLNPDAVVMDMSMPGLSGIEAARHIRSRMPHSKIVMLSLHESRQLVESVLELGAAGYVVKPRADSDLIDALNAVMRGETYVSPTIDRARATGA